VSDETVSFLPEQHFRERVERRFATLRTQLQAMIPGAGIEHVGSTSIPGSLTKGDLDIQVRVAATQFAAAKIELSQLYDVNAGGFAAADAVSFEDHSTEPHVGIHLTVVGGTADAQWRFRDLLRASEHLRREYDDLKRGFEGCSMAKYREAKDAFVARVLGADIRQRLLREATAADVAPIQRIRRAVRENRLVSTTIADEQVREAIESTGRGWIIETAGEVVAFAIGNATNGNLWALFVHPDHERHGYGRVLHDTAVEWLWAQGLERLWLTTEPRTRAQSFYEAAGWQLKGLADHGEVRYERSAPSRAHDD
jgi:GrpB-like predicted nucleotidyltransferase (UPF0157 family)/N-acetylglutamate synthase-like GNAT family acetyltransferase